MDDDDEGPALEPHWPRPTPRRSRCLCHSTDLRSVERRACARLTERGQAIREWKPKRPLDVTGGRGGQRSCQSVRRVRSTYRSISTSHHLSSTQSDEPTNRCARRGLTTDGRGRRGRAQEGDMKARKGLLVKRERRRPACIVRPPTCHFPPLADGMADGMADGISGSSQTPASPLSHSSSSAPPSLSSSHPPLRSYRRRCSGRVVELVAAQAAPSFSPLWPADLNTVPDSAQLPIRQCQPSTALQARFHFPVGRVICKTGPGRRFWLSVLHRDTPDPSKALSLY